MNEETAVRIATALERHVEQQDICVDLQKKIANAQSQNAANGTENLKLRMVELRFAIMQATDAVRNLPDRVDEYTKLLAELEPDVAGA